MTEANIPEPLRKFALDILTETFQYLTQNS